MRAVRTRETQGFEQCLELYKDHSPDTELPLAVGAGVMLGQNIWADQSVYFLLCHYSCANFDNPGLVNETRATIVQTAFALGADYKIDLLQFVIVEIDGYTGIF